MTTLIRTMRSYTRGAVRPILDPIRKRILTSQVRNLQERIDRRFATTGVPPPLALHLRNLVDGRVGGRPLRRGLLPIAGHATDVLYVSASIAPDAMKDLIALRRHGAFRCTLLFSHGFGNEAPLRAAGVDLIRFHDEFDLARQLLATDAAILIARRGNPYHVAFAAGLGEGALIYKPYDFVLRDGRTPESVPPDSPAAAEAFALRRASALLHNHHEIAIQTVRERLGFSGVDVQVDPGCMPDFARERLPKLSAEDGGIHVAYAGGLSGITSDVTKVGLADQYDDFVRILRQGVHVHLYVAYRKPGYEAGRLRHYFELAKTEPRFHIHESLPYVELVRELSRYDVGWSYFPARGTQKERAFWGAVANNFYTYVEAGLPVVSAPDTWRQAELVEQLGIGLVVKPEEIDDLKVRLGNLDSEATTRVASAARGVLAYDSEAIVSLVRSLLSREGVPR